MRTGHDHVHAGKFQPHKRMGCGYCGNKEFAVYNTDQGDILIVECSKCMSKSVIKPTKPDLEIAFAPNSEGILSVLR